MTLINDFNSLSKIIERKAEFLEGKPFPHLIIDEFLPKKLAEILAQQFPEKEDDRLFEYDNPLEVKKALNDWNAYPPETYQLLQFLNSKGVVDVFSELLGLSLQSDNGLHGGGWHMHASGGKLNPHLDYSIHPKLGLQRKLNLIVYLSKDWKPEWGGDLGFWSHNQENNEPMTLIKETQIKFNRAILFDTTCDSWHGITKPVVCPQGRSRNSIAVYYLAEPIENTPSRSRALYAATNEQKGNEEIQKLIRQRADLKGSVDVYKKE